MIGTGTDIVCIERIGASLGRGPGFAEQVFAEGERRTCDSHRHPAQHCDAPFASKEAFLEAVSLGAFDGVVLRDVEATRTESGRPGLKQGPTALAALERAGATRAQVSLSRERAYAVAVGVFP